MEKQRADLEVKIEKLTVKLQDCYGDQVYAIIEQRLEAIEELNLLDKQWIWKK